MGDLTKKEKQRLERLRERAQWLSNRIAYLQDNGLPHKARRAEAERSALLWAIDVIENMEVVEDDE